MNELAFKSYGIRHTFSWETGQQVELWTINGNGTRGYCSVADKAVFTYTVPPETNDAARWADEPPFAVRQEYERLIDYRPGDRIPGVFNVVELAADVEGDDCSFDQPCACGHRVEDHAVYCHCDTWLYAPRKCRRNRTDYRHEDCPGFRQRQQNLKLEDPTPGPSPANKSD